jgi:prepilin-type N-terminal cleavage/methylation domain-containing protein
MVVVMNRMDLARRGREARPRRGFTLIETALATVIVGVGVLALVAAQQAFHRQNAWSTHASIALRLGNEIREMTLNLPRHDPVTDQEFWGPEANENTLDDFDDLDDFDGDGGGLVFESPRGDGIVNGPVNARREIIANMEGWSQTVTVSNVDPLNITDEVADGASELIMFRVVVSYQSPTDLEPQEVTTVSWIAPN